MAYVAGNMTEEELKKQNEQGAIQTGTGSGILGSEGVGAPQQTSDSPSGTFTNLRTYLDANRPQAADLANKVSGVIQNVGEQAKSQIEPLKTSYQETLKSAAPNVSLIEQAKADPVKFASDPNNVTAFGNLRKGLFPTPANFNDSQNYAKAVTSAQKASGLEKLASGEAGKSTLIRELNPTMKQGNVDFNTVLLQGDPSARTQVVQAAKPYAGLLKTLSEVEAEATKNRQSVLDQQAEANKRTQDEFVNPKMEELKGLKDTINKRVTDYSADQVNKNQAIKTLKDYIGGTSELNLSPDQQKLFFGDTTPKAGFNSNQLRQELDNRFKITNFGGRDPEAMRQAAINEAYNEILGDTSTEDIWDKKYNAPYKQKIAEQYYAYDYPTYLKLNPQEDWLNKYFAGTQESVGETLPKSVASQEEAAKILALQKLLDQPEFLTEEDLAMAGSYRPAQIGKFTLG